MLALISRWVIGLIGIALVATGIALGAYFATQTDDGSTTVREEPNAPPTPIPGSPLAIAPSPPPSPSPAASPAPEPGVCPTPLRATPADFGDPRPVLPLAEVPGWRVQGGATFKEGYLNLYLPASRQFIIATGSGERGNVSIRVYDIEAESSLVIRGDGCEKERFVRDPAVDAVFDEILATLEVGSTYVCPPASRSTLALEEAPVAVSGEGVSGGEAYELPWLGLTLHLPAGRRFQVWTGLADPGGGFIGIYDISARSFLFLRPDGCETSRRVADPAADAVFDEIVATLEVER